MGFDKVGIISFRQARDGDFAGAINGYDENVIAHKRDTDIIGQEYEYHRLLDGNDSEHEEDPEDPDIEFDKDLLLTGTPAGEACPNIDRDGEQGWLKDPKLPQDSMNMAFRSRIAQLCSMSAVRSCEDEICREYRETISLIAPQCNWQQFREWAVVAMSCQRAMAQRGKASGDYGKGHTHLARSVAGCCMILKEYLEGGEEKLIFQKDSSPDSETSQLDQSVVEVIYWMAKIQYEKTIGPDKFGSWSPQFIPYEMSLPVLEADLEKLNKAMICKTRFWNLVRAGERKEADISLIVQALCPEHESPASPFAHLSLNPKTDQEDYFHGNCNSSKCQLSSISSTSKLQRHKEHYGGTCSSIHFNTDRLVNAVDRDEITAWQLEERELYTMKEDPDTEGYMAISHVWADGTGQGSQNEHGHVNSCLFEYWKRKAVQLGCEGIWWDVISVPSKANKDQYNRALKKMHLNYSKAKLTFVHDLYLQRISGENKERACIALVLSTWFTRGWTAVELARSNEVWIQFEEDEPVELETILAKSPAEASRAHWIATSWIKRLREPINDIGDILAILAPRTTETLSDRPVIAALLADVPDIKMEGGEASITKQILKYLGRMPQSCLLHGQATMRDVGDFSWCAGRLDDMPIPIPTSMESREASDSITMIEIDPSGAIEGYWYCCAIDKQTKDAIRPYGNDLSSIIKISLALRNWENCLLLQALSASKGDSMLLVQCTEIDGKKESLQCHYIGTVQGEAVPSLGKWHIINIKLGADESLVATPSANVLTQVHDEGMCKQHGIEHNSGEKFDEETDTKNAMMSPHTSQVAANIIPALYPDSPESSYNNQLQRAILKGKHRAVHHIVGMMDKADLIQESADHIIARTYGSLGQESKRQAKQAHWSLGDAFVYHGKFQQAVQAYRDVLQDYPTPMFLQPAVTYNIGMVQVLNGEYVEAKRSFIQALRLCDNPRPQVNRLAGIAAKQRSRLQATSDLVWAKPVSQNELDEWETVEEGWEFVRWKAVAALILLGASHQVNLDQQEAEPNEQDNGSLEDDIDWRNIFCLNCNRLLRLSENKLNIREVFGEELDPDNDLRRQEVITYLLYALGRFKSMFHQNHPMIFITSRVIGDWMIRHGDWYETEGDVQKKMRAWKHAQRHFNESVKGLQGFGFFHSQAEEQSSQNRWIKHAEGQLGHLKNFWVEQAQS